MSETNGQNLDAYIAASQTYFAKEFEAGTPHTSFSGSVTAENVTITYGITWSDDAEGGGTAAVDVTRHSPDANIIFPESLDEGEALIVNLLHNAMAEVPSILAESPTSDDEDYVESFGIRLAIAKPEFVDAKDEKDWREMIANFVFPVSVDMSYPMPAYSFEPLGYSRKEIPFAMGAVAFRAVTGDTPPANYPEFWTYASRVTFDSPGEEADDFLKSLQSD